MKYKLGTSTRKTMLEFQQNRIEVLEKTNHEYFEKIKELNKLNDDLFDVLADVLDNDCQEHYKEIARSFIYNQLNEISSDE
ncbi:MAG: hypothetical protein Unbinned5607contig1000_53 [Prokaryotic dsDNA virus sp.]|nr:MAG: hypothetical protein Unbinned5607contig1000_53 [Prokaryotic dsDNA virus sp.]|tara:strand:+ start:23330 stop:23572 length:243 start_codon:yes stop_codon:yes gene_type:complete